MTATPPNPGGATVGSLWVWPGVLLVRGAVWGLPQLVVGQVRWVVVHALEGDLRERLVGGVAVEGHGVGVGEVGGRGVDDREVGGPGRRRIVFIDDEHR